MKKRFFGWSMVGFALVLLLSGCATLFNNKQTTVSASSGSASEVTILENGSVVYQGQLPATINVNGSNNYVVQYTDRNGNPRSLQLQKNMSGWFVADILLLGGWIIDLITGDVMVYERTAVLPISYNNSERILFIDNIPEELKTHLRVIENIYKTNE